MEGGIGLFKDPICMAGGCVCRCSGLDAATKSEFWPRRRATIKKDTMMVVGVIYMKGYQKDGDTKQVEKKPNREELKILEAMITISSDACD